MRTYVEFDNASKFSKYPFLDSASLLDSNGSALASDFMLDASMCLKAADVPYLSALSDGVGVFSCSSGVVATFEYSGPGSVPVLDSKTGKELGFVFLGAAATGLEKHTFSSSATTLCPSCFCLFQSNAPVFSISSGDDDNRLGGAVRIYGENGVYVTKTVDSETNAIQLRIDIIGPSQTLKSCCDDPIRGIVIRSFGCPPVAAVPALYPQADITAADEIIPGVIMLDSPLTADAVCGKKERYVSDDGEVGLQYCDKDENPPETVVPCIESGPYIIKPSNGGVDFIPSSVRGASPVVIDTTTLGSAAEAVSNFSDPSMKNLAIIENSGSVVIKLKGRI